MSGTPMIESSEHPMVVGAMARLATQGGWARILAGKPLEDVLDINDAELLLAAQVLRRNDDDSLEPIDAHPWYFDPSSLAGARCPTCGGCCGTPRAATPDGTPTTSRSSSPGSWQRLGRHRGR